VGQSVVHKDIVILSAKLGPEQAAGLDSEASARVREHYTVRETIPTDGANWDRHILNMPSPFEMTATTPGQ
jgi:hypothetical protein